MSQIVAKKRVSLFYFFEDAVKRVPNNECIWSREGCYTWTQTYDRANQYAHWFLSQGVKPHDYVAFYLTNSPDFIFAWLGLWAIGAAPAMINYNLAGKALIHCLKVSGATVLLVDEDPILVARIEEARARIEGEVKMQIRIVDSEIKKEIRSQDAERIADVYREVVQGNWPMAMFYTSGTTGMPKGVPFQMVRGFPQGGSVTSSFAVKHSYRFCPLTRY
jgi:acyl-CoA synthetase (AMP-forming)/AMP-acid ligase II